MTRILSFEVHLASKESEDWQERLPNRHLLPKCILLCPNPWNSIESSDSTLHKLSKSLLYIAADMSVPQIIAGFETQ